MSVSHTNSANTTPLSVPTVLPSAATKEATPFTTNVLIVGGAYAGLSAVRSFKKQFQQRSEDPLYASALANKYPKISITLIEPRAGLLNIIGIPRAFVDTEFAQTQYIPFDQFNDLSFDKIISNDGPTLESLVKVHNPTSNHDFGIELIYIHGKINTLDEKSASYSLNNSTESAKINYDYAILASGRNRSWPTTPEGFTLESYLAEMESFKKEIEKHEVISIIGAGAVGIEVAGDIKHKYPSKTVNLIHPHPAFPPEPLSKGFQQMVAESLVRGGVNIHYNTRIAKELPNGDLVTTDNKTIKSDYTQWCNSHKNNTEILSPELKKAFVTPANNILVNEYLQLQNSDSKHTNFFVLGDLVELPIIKSAGWAMYMGRQVANNITSLILDDKLVEPLPDISAMPRGMVLVAGNEEIVSELSGVVELNHEGYVNEYKDYCVGKIRATIDL